MKLRDLRIISLSEKKIKRNLAYSKLLTIFKNLSMLPITKKVSF